MTPSEQEADQFLLGKLYERRRVLLLLRSSDADYFCYDDENRVYLRPADVADWLESVLE